jgi:hypothetical protein
MNGWAIRVDLAAVFAIARLAVREYRARGGLWLSWLLLGWLALMLAAAFAFPAMDGTKPVLPIIAGIPLAMLVLLWWTQLVSTIRLQYTPSAARLVPYMRQRVMAVLLLAWLAASVLLTLVPGIALGRPVAVFVITGLVLVEVAMSSAWRAWIFLLLWTGPFFGRLTPADFGNALDSSFWVGLLSALLVIEGRTAIDKLLGKPGGLPPPGTAASPPAPKTAVAASRSPLAWAFGPRSAMNQLLAIAGMVAVPCLAGAARVDDPAIMSLLRAAMLATLLASLSIVAHLMVSALYGARAEQALIRLAPRVPAARYLNAVLAGRLLGEFALACVGVATCALVLMLGMGANLREAVSSLATFSVAPFAAGHLLRDYAGARKTGLSVRLVYWVAAPVGLAVAFMTGSGKLDPGTAIAVAAAGLAGGALFVRWRWSAMMRAVPALPAGRAG